MNSDQRRMNKMTAAWLSQTGGHFLVPKAVG
jgi:hypothetical protein